MKKRRLLAVATAMLTAISMTGCSFNNTASVTSGTDSTSESSSSTEATTEHAADEMIVGSMVEATSLDPAFNMSFGSYQVLNQVCDTVLSLDQDGNVVDGIAHMEQTDPTTYVYTFQEGILFSDGTELTAEDAAFSIQHVMDPSVGGGASYKFSNVDSVEATDKYVMTIKLKQPDSSWAGQLSGEMGHVFSKAAYEAVGPDKFGTPDGLIIGSGAYKVDSWELGVQTVLSKNENYRDVDDVDINKVTILYFSDTSAELMALKSGQIDQIIAPDANMFKDIDALDNVDRITADPKGGEYLAFNCQTGPFSDINVRKAVSAALDKNSLMISQYGESDSVEATSLYPPTTALSFGKEELAKAAVETKEPEYDLDAAKKYLSESAYPDGFDCNIMSWGDMASANMCVAIQSMLKELNINVEVVQQTVDENIAAGYGFTLNEDGTRTYDMFLATWSTVANDSLNYYDALVTSKNIGQGGTNLASYSNAEVDSLVEAIKATTDEAEMTQNLIKVNEILTDDMPYCVIGYFKSSIALNKRFTYEKFSSSWIGNLDYADIKIAK